MSTLTPFEFGKRITNNQSEVGSFLSPRVGLNSPRWLKNTAMLLIVGFAAVFAYGIYEKQRMMTNESWIPNEEPTTIYNESVPTLPTIDSTAIYQQEAINAEIQRIKFENSNPIPKLISAIEDDEDESDWIVLDKIRFSGGSSELLNYEQLIDVASILADNPEVMVKVGGFTDNSGGYVENLEISKSRAMNVALKLNELGVGEDQLYFEGFGSSMPLCSEELSEDCKTINRRIAIQIISNFE